MSFFQEAREKFKARVEAAQEKVQQFLHRDEKDPSPSTASSSEVQVPGVVSSSGPRVQLQPAAVSAPASSSGLFAYPSNPTPAPTTAISTPNPSSASSSRPPPVVHVIQPDLPRVQDDEDDDDEEFEQLVASIEVQEPEEPTSLFGRLRQKVRNTKDELVGKISDFRNRFKRRLHQRMRGVERKMKALVYHKMEEKLDTLLETKVSTAYYISIHVGLIRY